MPTVFAAGKTKLIEPEEYGFVDAWAPPLNSNFGVTDAALTGTTTINVSTISSGAPFVTLVFDTFTTTQTPWLQPLAGQNLRVLLTGTLAFNIIVYIPANNPGLWVFDNQTSGAYTVTVKTTALTSVGVNVSQGYMSMLFCDGTNVGFSDLGNIVANVPSSVPVGSIMPYGGASIPSTFWLLCDGTAVPRTTYPALFSAIGTLWGAGDGSNTFNLPNLRGAFLRGAGAGLNPSARAVGSYEADANLAHTHTATVTDPGHKHTIPAAIQQGSGTGPSSNPLLNSNPGVSSTATTGITIVNANSGGAEAVPKNFAVNYIIKAV